MEQLDLFTDPTSHIDLMGEYFSSYDTPDSSIIYVKDKNGAKVGFCLYAVEENYIDLREFYIVEQYRNTFKAFKLFSKFIFSLDNPDNFNLIKAELMMCDTSLIQILLRLGFHIYGASSPTIIQVSGKMDEVKRNLKKILRGNHGWKEG